MARSIQDKVKRYYSEKVLEHGATSKGVDWNGEESHQLRFRQLVKLIDPSEPFSLLDYGCGFGSLISFMENQVSSDFKYFGYDLSIEMIRKGKEKNPDKNFVFTDNLSEVPMVDYTIANGLFNVRLDSTKEDWEKYVLTCLNEINTKSQKGFSFNILTSFSDKEFMKDYLYYADPLHFFGYCKEHFSKNVALLHDYNLYEFTIIVRK